MNELQKEYDVVVVGASIGGSTAATLFARQGLRVALVERNADIDAYKIVCTHFIQPHALPVIKRLGLADDIEAAGGLRNGSKTWTRWGWLGIGANGRYYGYNVRRQVLDPLLRRQAAATTGVDFLPGTAVRELIYEGDRVAGVRASNRDRQTLELRAKLVVGADGRYSRTAELAGLPAQTQPNERFLYFAYFRNLPLVTGRSAQIWHLEPDVAYALPNDNGLTLLAVMLPKSKLAEFKRDVAGNFFKFFEVLANAPNLNAAEQVSDIMGMLDMPTVSRPAAAPGLALVGDAALTSDPVWGYGIAAAFQSADWLVKHTAKAVGSGDAQAIDEALGQYRRYHEQRLAARHAHEVDFARARPFNVLERLMYEAASHDAQMLRYAGPYSLRPADMRHLPPFKAIVKALRINLAYRYQNSRLPVAQARLQPSRA